jgi:hypothetical protein
MPDDNTITNFVTHVFVLNSNITHALRYKEMFIGIDLTLPLVHEGHISTVLRKLMDDAHQ